MAAGVRGPDVHVGGLAEVFVGAYVADVAHVLVRDALEYGGGVAAKGLPRRFQEDPLGRGEDARDGKAGVINAIFAAQQIVGHHGTIGPLQRVVVNRIHLAEGRAHLADFGDESARQRRKCEVALFHVYALFSEREKEIAAGVWIDDGLQTKLGFVHLESPYGANAVLPGGAQKSPDDADVRDEKLGVRSRAG